MRELNIRNITLIALVTCWFIQVGGQVFALTAVDAALVSAPPRSFAMLQGEFRYDSSAFWSTVPLLNSLLLVLALAANWRTARRNLMLMVLTLFAGIALVSMVYIEPTFDEIKAIGYRDEVDPVLQQRAMTWHRTEWAVWGSTLLGGLILLFALARPVTQDNTSKSS